MIPPFVPHCGVCNKPRPCTCGTTPAQPAPAVTPAAAPDGRYVLRNGYEVCVECNFAREYCRGHAPADAAGVDGADTSLIARIIEARQRGGGR